MTGPEILYCLDKGDFEYVISDVQDYLLVPLESKDKLSKSDLESYSYFAYQFLHKFLYKFEEIFHLEGILDVIKDCYVVAKICPATKTGKDALFLENHLYHIISKLIKKQMFSWTRIFCDLVVKELTVLRSDDSYGEVVTNLAYVLYAALWNAMIAAEKQTSKATSADLFVRLECRNTALQLLDLTMKDVSMYVERTLISISRVIPVIVAKPAIKEKVFSLLNTMVSNALKVICRSPEDLCEHVSKLVVAQIQLLMRFEGFTDALNASLEVCVISDKIISENDFGPVLSFISGTLCVNVHAQQLKLHLAQKKEIGSISELSLSMAKCEKLLRSLSKTPSESRKTRGLLHSAMYSLDYLYSIVQTISHMKISTKTACDLMKIIIDFSASVAALSEVIQQKPDDKSQTNPWGPHAESQILHLKIVYYFLTLFIQDGIVCSIHQRAARCISNVERTLESLDKATSHSVETQVDLVEVVFKIGRQFYFSRKFSDAVLYLVTTCAHIRHLLAHNRKLPDDRQNGRHYTFLADTYRHNNEYQNAMQCIVLGIQLDPNNLGGLVTCWVKVKVELQERKQGEAQISRTLCNCYKDPSFVTFLPQSPGCSSDIKHGNTQLSSKVLLEAELQALKDHWCPVNPALLAVYQEWIELVTDPIEKCHLLVEQAHILWLSHHKDGLYETCVESIRTLEGALEQRTSTTAYPYLEDQLATTYLWSYIIQDVDPVQMLKTLQEKKGSKYQAPEGSTSAPDSRPGTPTGDNFTEAENFEDCVTVAMETELLHPVNQALELWEGLIKSGPVDERIRSVKETVELLFAVSAIYKLAKKHMHHWRALVACLTLAHSNKCHQLCLQVRIQLLQLLNDLCQPQLSEEITMATDVWINSVKTEKLLHSVYYAQYLMVKADTLILLGKSVEGQKVLSQAMQLKSKHLKSRTRDGLLIEALMCGMNSRLLDTMTANKMKPPGNSSVLPPGDSSVLPPDTKIEMLNQATRLVTSVVSGLMGDWMVNQSSVAGVETKQAPINTLDKWLLLDRLLETLYDAGLYATELGKARNAACLLTVGIRLTKAFLLPRRLAEFHLALASLDTLRGKHIDCRAHLHIVSYIHDSNETTRDKPRPDLQQPDEDETMGFQIKSQPMEMEDEDPEKITSDLDNFDRSGCASPTMKKKKVKIPENWTHKVTCNCQECIDIAQIRISICKFSIDAQMNIYEEDYQEAKTSLQMMVKNMEHLVTKSQHTLRNLTRDIHKIIAIFGNTKDLKNKRMDENKAKHNIGASVYQELIVDVCLQACRITVELNNNAQFEQWSQRCNDLCDTDRYPWMYSKQTVLAELQYLNAVLYLDVYKKPQEKYNMDKLCILMSITSIKDGGTGECHTPDTSQTLALAKSFDLTPEMPDTTGKKVQFTAGNDDSPAYSAETNITDITMAPMKANRTRGYRITSRDVGRAAKPLPADITIDSSSVPQSKSAAAWPQRIKAQSGIPLRIYQEPSDGTQRGQRSKTLSHHTPVKMATTRIGNMLKTPVSVCSSRRAVLDTLIDSDSEDESLIRQKKKKSAKVKGQGHLKTLATKRPSKSTKKAQNAKCPGPIQSLFSKQDKKEVIRKNQEETASDNIYDFTYFSDDDNKSKVKNTKGRMRKATGSRSSKDMVVEASRSENKELGIYVDVDHNEIVKTVGSSRQKKSALPKAKINTAENDENTSKPRLTRAKTKVTEAHRAPSQDDDVERQMEIFFESINLNLVSENANSDDSLITRIDEETPEPFSQQQSTNGYTSRLIEELVESEPDVSPLRELNDSIEVLRADYDSCETKSRSGKGRASGRTIKSKIPKPKPEPDDEVEISRMSRVRPLQPSSEINNLSAKRKEIKGQALYNTADVKKADKVLNPLSSTEALNQMKRVFQSIRHSPPSILYRNVSHSIALALLHDSAPVWEIVFYLTEAQAITFRHKALLSWRSRLRKLEKEDVVQTDAIDLATQRTYLTDLRQQIMFDKTPEDLQAAVRTLPPTWTICQISVISNPGSRLSHLVITRLTPQREPLVIRLPGYSDAALVVKLLEDYNSIFRRIAEAIKVTDRAQWWKYRYQLDDDVKVILGRFEHSWLGSWKGILQGMLVHPDDRRRLTDSVNKLITKWKKTTLVPDAFYRLELLLLAESHLSEHELLQGIVDICSEPRPVATEICERVKLFKKVAKYLNLDMCSRGLVILVLDKDIQHLPWENFPSLQSQQMTRMPSIYFISAHYNSLSANKKSVWNQGVKTNKTFYIVDPDSNLPATGETFRKWFERMEGWQGLMQQKPTSQEFKEGISSNDLFIYCGHGSGAKYLSSDSLEMCECHAASLLMGCSSGKLTSAGQLEACGIMLNYFIAGGPCMMGCLWDITGRDIDRYTEHLLKELLATRGQGVLDVVDTSRSACKLRYLTGAAPVFYGLPVKIAPKERRS